MNDIKNIIQSRIRDFAEIPSILKEIHKNNQKIQTPTDAITLNKQIIKQINQYKKKERLRSIKQSELLSELNSIFLNCNEIIEQFLSISIDICETYDKNYSHFRNMSRIYYTPEEAIRKLYNSFLIEQGLQNKAKQTLQIIHKQLTNLSPAMFLGLLSEWSKMNFLDVIQSQTTNQYIRNDEILKNSNYMKINLKSIDNKMNRSVVIKQIKLQPYQTIANKEGVYGYILEQMNAIYKSFPFDDLDLSYLRLIKKKTCKDHLNQDDILNDAVKILIESKNKFAKKCIKQYYQSYAQKYQINPNASILKFSQISKRSYKELEIDIKSIMKSQPNQINKSNDTIKNVEYAKQSDLLSPKSAQIYFKQENIAIVPKPKQNQLRFELPMLAHRNKLRLTSPKTPNNKNKDKLNFILNLTPEKNPQLSTKQIPLLLRCFTMNSRIEQKGKAAKLYEKINKNNSSIIREQTEEDDGLKQRKDRQKSKIKPRMESKISQQNFIKNRKLMLQLLREKIKPPI